MSIEVTEPVATTRTFDGQRVRVRWALIRVLGKTKEPGMLWGFRYKVACHIVNTGTSCTITLPYDKWVQLSAGAEAYLLFENEGGRGWTATSREYTHVPPSPALSRGRAR